MCLRLVVEILELGVGNDWPIAYYFGGGGYEISSLRSVGINVH